MSVTLDKVKLPIEFEMLKETDSRFRKVKIWIAHTGENLNGSYFEKDVLEDMAKTLSGTPIVGFVERVEGTEEDDFSDHRNEITVKENGIHIRYAGHAYGFIPEDNNHQIEIRNGKEWLTAEGYLWTKFRDAMDIFTSTNGIKSQSMEIDNVEGAVDDLGRIEIQSARFSALCILGDHTQPAMDGSTVEFFSDKENHYQSELNEMIHAFELEKGESRVPLDEELEQELAIDEPEQAVEETEVKEDVEVQEQPEIPSETPKEVEDVEEFSDESEEVEDTDAETEKDTAEKTDVEQPEVEGAPAVESTEEVLETESEGVTTEEAFTLQFELSHDDVRTKLYKALANAREDGDYSEHYIIDVFDNHFIYQVDTYDESGWNSKFIKVTYDKLEDGVSLGEHAEIFPMFVSVEEKEAIDAQRSQIADLTQQLGELRGFKAVIDNQQKEETVQEFEEQIGTETADEIRAKFSQFSVEEVENEVAMHCFQFMRKQPKDETVVVPSNQFKALKSTDGADKYGSLNRLFNSNI